MVRPVATRTPELGCNNDFHTLPKKMFAWSYACMTLAEAFLCETAVPISSSATGFTYHESNALLKMGTLSAYVAPTSSGARSSHPCMSGSDHRPWGTL